MEINSTTIIDSRLGGGILHHPAAWGGPKARESRSQKHLFSEGVGCGIK